MGAYFEVTRDSIVPNLLRSTVSVALKGDAMRDISSQFTKQAGKVPVSSLRNSNTTPSIRTKSFNFVFQLPSHSFLRDTELNQYPPFAHDHQKRYSSALQREKE